MAIQENALSPEQKQMEQALQAEGEKDFASKLAASMDLPSTLMDAVDEQEKQAQKAEEVEEVEEPTETEEQEEVVEEETEQTEDSDGEEETKEEETDVLNEDEDLVPKSKVQKRFDELTRQIKELQQELKAKAEQTPPQQKDDQQEKLDRMSEDELRVLKRQVRLEQIKSTGDEGKLAQLLDLEEKIDGTIRTAPHRFQSNQMRTLNDAISDSKSRIENFEKVAPTIDAYALEIYKSSPELQNSVTGKARAWKLATDHFAALQKISEGKSEDTELKRKMNNLKKKISIDSTSKKAVQVPDSSKKLFKKAVYGTEQDKKAFVKSKVNFDAFFPE